MTGLTSHTVHFSIHNSFYSSHWHWGRNTKSAPPPPLPGETPTIPSWEQNTSRRNIRRQRRRKESWSSGAKTAWAAPSSEPMPAPQEVGVARPRPCHCPVLLRPPGLRRDLGQPQRRELGTSLRWRSTGQRCLCVLTGKTRKHWLWLRNKIKTQRWQVFSQPCSSPRIGKINTRYWETTSYFI